MEQIKDSMGKTIGTSTTSGNKTTVREFKSSKVVATYDSKSNTTWDLNSNKVSKGNQAVRSLK